MVLLPVISGREAAKAFEKIGFIFPRQRGSHMILYHQTGGTSQYLIIKSSTVEHCRH
jgi:predicted RNA binding protein YcfA (HicA-like mRNA interferase family)